MTEELWQAVSIPNDGNQYAINMVINMIMNSDILLSKLGISKTIQSTYEQIKSKSNLVDVPILSLYAQYADVYLNMENSERRSELLNIIHSSMYDARTKSDNILSPSSVLHDIFPDVLYINIDVMKGDDSRRVLLTSLSQQTNSEDVFAEVNISEYVPDRTQITETQMERIDDIMKLAVMMSENNYVCTDMMLEVYASTEKKPSRVAYYNTLENRIQNDNIVAFIPYTRFKTSYDTYITINGKDYNNLYLQTSDGDRVYYTPSLFHFQVMPESVIKILCQMGYNYGLRSVYVFHTIITVTERIKAIFEYVRMSDRSVVHTKTRYGNSLKNTLRFYSRCRTMSKARAREIYANLKYRKYNVFEEFVNIESGEVCKIDSTVYDIIFN